MSATTSANPAVHNTRAQKADERTDDSGLQISESAALLCDN